MHLFSSSSSCFQVNDLHLFQRNLDQLEALSKKLKAKTLQAEAPSQSIAATRFLYDSCCRSSHVILTPIIT